MRIRELLLTIELRADIEERARDMFPENSAEQNHNLAVQMYNRLMSEAKRNQEVLNIFAQYRRQQWLESETLKKS